MYILGNMWDEALDGDGSKLFTYEDGFISASIESPDRETDMKWRVVSKRSFERVEGHSTNWIDANLAVDAFARMVVDCFDGSSGLPACPHCGSRMGYDVYGADVSVGRRVRGATVRMGISGNSVIDYGDESGEDVLGMDGVGGPVICVNCESVIKDGDFIGRLVGPLRSGARSIGGGREVPGSPDVVPGRVGGESPDLRVTLEGHTVDPVGTVVSLWMGSTFGECVSPEAVQTLYDWESGPLPCGAVSEAEDVLRGTHPGYSDLGSHDLVERVFGAVDSSGSPVLDSVSFTFRIDGATEGICELLEGIGPSQVLWGSAGDFGRDSTASRRVYWTVPYRTLKSLVGGRSGRTDPSDPLGPLVDGVVGEVRGRPMLGGLADFLGIPFDGAFIPCD